MIRLANYSPYKQIIYLAIMNLLQYHKNMKIIKVKRGTSTFVHFFLQKFFLKLTLKICNTHYSDYTVLVLSEDTSAPTVRENHSASQITCLYTTLVRNECHLRVGDSFALKFEEVMKRVLDNNFLSISKNFDFG